ncbi:MAG: hypothetical protein GX102_02840 [Porphyromonadaceae bacterium]|jgi:hypothetical protein|nr:hypothetical protein [Porphyromonadaceae bacterium]
MRKLRILFSFALPALLFGGCTKDEEPNYAELLKGTWVNTLVNEQPVLTDATYVMEFKSDNTELYATGYQLDENNKSWRVSSNYTYNINGNLVYIDGTDVLGDSYRMVLKILSLKQEILTSSVQTFILNGEAITNTNTYSSQKVSDDYSDEFTGIWYGRCTTEGSPDSLYHYWEYFDDGTYNYYYQYENSNWIKKEDNEGHYFLYGNLMASNYSHDLLSGGTGLAYECWNFTIDGNKMIWTGLRENNITITYEMEKVQSPPETL